ncbi:hypothetical protein Godav_013962, partial [Gossypium davidsonii]|nr:hypothetical protein [Gossypium davidsonii]
MSDQSEELPLMAPPPITEPSEIDLEAGPADQIQCRICLETDGIASHGSPTDTDPNEIDLEAGPADQIQCEFASKPT